MQAITHPGARERRFTVVALVGALHIAAIYTLLVALDIVPPPLPSTPVNFRYVPPTQAKTIPMPPPTGPIAFIRPDSPTVPQPDFHIGSDPGPGAITTLPPGPADTFMPASALAGTHSTPDYPMLDRRLSHEGTVRLALSIDALGNVTAANVEQSSGYDGLDAAAITWVKAHWRYKPALHDRTPVATTTKASIVFRLTQVPY